MCVQIIKSERKLTNQDLNNEFRCFKYKKPDNLKMGACDVCDLKNKEKTRD